MRKVAWLACLVAWLPTAAALGDLIIDDFSVGAPLSYQYSGATGSRTQSGLDGAHVLGGSRTWSPPSMSGFPTAGAADIDFDAVAGELGFSMVAGGGGGGRFALSYNHPDDLNLASFQNEYLRVTLDHLDAGVTKDGTARRDSLEMNVNLQSRDPITNITNNTIAYLAVFNAETRQEIYLPVSSLTSGSANPEHATRLTVTFDYLITDVSFVVSDIRILDLGVDLPGDFNDDGAVNAADYTVWRDRVGSVALGLPNDVNGGVVGAAQLATWKANYGRVVSGAASVPEPGTVGLLLTVLGLAARAATHRVEAD